MGAKKVTADRFVQVRARVEEVNQRTGMVKLLSMKNNRMAWMNMSCVEDPSVLVRGEVVTLRVEAWVLVVNGWTN